MLFTLRFTGQILPLSLTSSSSKLPPIASPYMVSKSSYEDLILKGPSISISEENVI